MTGAAENPIAVPSVEIRRRKADADRHSTLGRHEGPSDIARRKSEHVEVVLRGDVRARDVTTGLEKVRFEHCALPELSLDGIDLSTHLAGRPLAAPLIVSSMTGGPLHARRINYAIAEAAGRVGIGFAVGSQRIALEGRASAGFSRKLRSLAGNVPILANFGAAQLRHWPGTLEAERAIEMIDADALIIHLNPLQEAVQRGGDRDWSGLTRRIEELARAVSRPLIAKEVGFGISGPVARQLWNAGVTIIDVAGAGGTSWAAVESARASTASARAVAEAFRDWGVPTAMAIAEVRKACPEATIIASGGIRDGLDVAKAIRLGSDIAGQAAGILPAALEGPDAVAEHVAIVVEQLRIACFCTASANLAALRRARLVGCGE
jgi:isopentenyl-diphosphate delta-isomerase